MPHDLRTDLRHAFQDFMAQGFPALANSVPGFAEAHAGFARMVASALSPVTWISPGEIPAAALDDALRREVDRAAGTHPDPVEADALRECVEAMDRLHILLARFAGEQPRRAPEHE